MSDIPLDTARWLTSAVGLGVVDAAVESLDGGLTELTVVARLRSKDRSGEQVRAAIAAAVARRRARDRWADAERLLFTRESLEQASDPEVSRWRSRRFPADSSIVDLCAGVGGDTMALAERSAEVTAVDQDGGRLELLRHNLQVRGHAVGRVTQDVLEVALPAECFVHADPGRRRDGRRVRHLRDHLPPVGDLAARLDPVAGGAIVLSPAVDLEDPDLPAGELEFVQVGGNLVEAVLWLGGLRHADAVASCTLLPGADRLERTGEPVELPVGAVGDQLLTVAPAAVRARLHGAVGERVGARRLARTRALLTCDGQPPSDPWITARPVETVLPARPKAVRRWLEGVEELPLEVVVHGLDIDPVQWWRALGRPPRGPAGRRIEAVRTDAGAIVVVTRASS